MELNDLSIKDLSLRKGAHIFFIGIGGSSMSGLAELSLGRGYSVSGSDIGESAAISRLRSLGVSVFIGHNADNIGGDIDLVVYTLAISGDNPEYLRAKELGKPVVERGVFLGWIAAHFDSTVAISGVHGKTTTTSMVTSVLMKAGKNPSAHIGGVIHGLDSNVISGGQEIFVTEACEYHKNFLHIKPSIGTILNLEPEHLDYFKTFRNMKNAFRSFAESIPAEGYLIVCADSPAALNCAKKTRANIITYSTKSSSKPRLKNASGRQVFAHFYAKDPVLETISGDGFIRSGYRYELIRDGLKIADISLRIPGYYNVSDSLAAAAVSSAMGCAGEEISRGLSSFEGAKRRFEIVGKTQSGAVIISDYAHHPSEIKVTVDAARSNTNGKLIAVFQPHTFTRAKRFKRKFAKALKKADTVILTDIYAAREPDTGLISSDDLLRLFLRKGLNAVHISDFGDIAGYIKNCAGKDDAVLILGAGSVYKIAELIQ